MQETAVDTSISPIEYRETRDLPRDGVLVLYGACRWSSAEKPDQLMAALAGSNAVVSAWHNGRLVGLGNAITDGALVAYYPHLLVHPDYQRRGIGREIMRRLMERYAGYHQQAILADDGAIAFYRSCGFTKPANVRAMWVYSATDHGPPDHWSSKFEQLFWEMLHWRERSTRQNWAIGLVVAQVVMALLTAIGFFMEGDSIILTAPMLAVAGYVLAFVTWPMSSRRVLGFALSGPLATTVGALIVVTMQNDFLILFMPLLFIYPAAAIWTGRNVIEKVLHWQPVPASQEKKPQQYSLKSLFVVMTALALFFTLARVVIQMAGTNDDMISCGVYALVNIVLCGMIIGRFVIDRRRE